jgi:hypothetical protein
VHVTFEVPTDGSDRRYWWFHACGAAEPGKTIVNGKLPPEAAIIPYPGFMNPLEGKHISLKGWNCLQIVPRDGSYYVLPGGPYENVHLGDGRAETDMRIVVNKVLPESPDPSGVVGSVLNVSPAQTEEYEAGLDGTWLRQWDKDKNIVGVMLDDQLYVEQRVTLDVYFNRGRIVVYANGVQKLCNAFPKHPLSMAEAAVGLGHVLYHSSAERQGFLRNDWVRTGQYQYLHNLPFIDQRTFDNFGVAENATLPEGFEAGQCYVADH